MSEPIGDSTASTGESGAGRPRQAADTRKRDYAFNKLRKRLRHNAGYAIADFSMIEQGTSHGVPVGRQGFLRLLDILLHLQASAPVDFELIAVNLDQKQPDFPEHVLPDYLENQVPFMYWNGTPTAW